MTPRQTYLIGGIVFVCFLGVSLTRLGDFALDETRAHFPNAINYYQHGLAATFDSHYSAYNTPLPYIIVAFAAKIAGPTLLVARCVTCLFSYLMFLVVVRLLTIYGAPPHLAFVVLFFPYIFLNSFLYYAVNYGLFFALLAVLVLHRPNVAFSLGWNFLAGFSLALAVLCQQFYLVILVAVVLARIWLAVTTKKEPKTTLSRVQLDPTLLFALPLIIPCLLFVAWGGLTPPGYGEQAIGFYPSTIVATLTVTGLYFAPFLFQEIRTLTWRSIAISLVLAAGLTFAFNPVFSDRYGPGAFAGVTHHIIALTDRIAPFLPALLTVMLTMLGILVLLTVWKGVTGEREYFLYVSLFLLALACACLTFVGERHLLGYVALLLLLVLPKIKKPWDWLYPMTMGLFGVGYFVWWFFFKWAPA